jgi:UPF0755 protein
MRNILLFLATFFIAFPLLASEVISKESVEEEKGVVYEVTPNKTVGQVANELYEKHLIEHPRLFKWMATIKGKSNDLKAGEYFIEEESTPEEILDKLTAGAVIQHDLRIGEGWTFYEVLDAIKENPKLTHKITSRNPAVVAKQLGLPTPHPEGWFFPDTYHFHKGMTDVDFLKRAYRKMQLVLDEEWIKRDASVPYKKPYEALIMASIIESETGLSAEHRRVSGVYVRRLKKNMRLQADPTVLYGLGESYEGPLKRSKLKVHTPYNTYMINGLPPTPICMPGRAAIHAAMHPANGTELYFVATGEGGHQFSNTFEEHSAAVARYRAWQAEQKE